MLKLHKTPAGKAGGFSLSYDEFCQLSCTAILVGGARIMIVNELLAVIIFIARRVGREEGF